MDRYKLALRLVAVMFVALCANAQGLYFYGGGGGGINGVTVTGTPSSGQVPTATSSTAATWQTPSGGGGLSFPFTVVQEGGCAVSSNVNTVTCTFYQTTASSGNTIFLVCSSDGSATVTLPTGWTSDINQVGATYSRALLLHKATASDTSAAFTISNSTTSCYYFEIVGSHTLDQHSQSSGSFNSTYENLGLPSITPTSGSMVIAMFGIVGYTWCSPPVNPAWHLIQIGNNNNTDREVCGYVYGGTSSGSAIQPPSMTVTGGLFQQVAAFYTASIL
jgi:hypothetical protein